MTYTTRTGHIALKRLPEPWPPAAPWTGPGARRFAPRREWVVQRPTPWPRWSTAACFPRVRWLLAWDRAHQINCNRQRRRARPAQEA